MPEMSISSIILFTFIGYITAIILLMGREILSIFILIFLFILTVLGLFFFMSVITLNWNEALMFFVLTMIFLNLTFFMVYFIPIGIVGRTFSLPFATISIILLNFLVYIPSRPEINLDLFEGLILKYYDLNLFNFFTAMFHHANIYHLLFNMLFLWIFGSYLEGRIGWKKFIAFYLVSGITATLGQTLFHSVVTPHPWRGGGFLGASGAISGVMGMFLMRCGHTKIRFIPNPYIAHIVGFPKLNSFLFIILSFFTDLIVAFFVLSGRMYCSIGVAAHITGFLCGVALAQSRQMKNDAYVEGLYNSALEDIQPENKDLKGAENKFLEVVKQRQDLPEPYLHLARIFSMDKVASADGNGTMPDPQGKFYYEKAIRLYYNVSWKTAGEIFREYFKKYMQPLEDLQLHVRASKALIRMKNYNDAERALEAVTKISLAKGPLIEEAYMLRGKLLEGNLEMQEPALRVYDEFINRFPISQFRDTAIERLKGMGVEVLA